MWVSCPGMRDCSACLGLNPNLRLLQCILMLVYQSGSFAGIRVLGRFRPVREAYGYRSITDRVFHSKTLSHTTRSRICYNHASVVSSEWWAAVEESVMTGNSACESRNGVCQQENATKESQHQPWTYVYMSRMHAAHHITHANIDLC